MSAETPLAEAITKKTTVKIVVTVPESHVESVRQAFGDAGAGVIGNYDYCSVTSPVEGRFRPTEGADPHDGEIGKLQVAQELRVETQCDAALARKVIEAMCAAHPYEEPAYDVYPLFAFDDLP